MLLEKVPPHPFRSEIYINTVITPHEEVKKSDKMMVKRILLKEVATKELKVIA
ncbi:MAG: hypothetical protein KAT66_09835 [Candidatus Lokiarchaeota archaeon]|nr:hypothetical protein [Candidatus Lokiarchaeota archaeon]